MDIRQIALPNKHGSLDLFLSVDFAGVVSVWSFLRRREMSTIKTCFDIGGKRLAVDGTGNQLAAASFKTGKVECFSLEGEMLWQRKYKQPQFLSWIPALSLWSIGLEAGNCFLVDQTGQELSSLKGVERVFPLGADFLLCVERKTISILDASLNVKCNLTKESFAVLDCDFLDHLVATTFAGSGAFLFDMKKRSCVRLPLLSGQPQSCTFADSDTVYTLIEHSGEGREVAAHTGSESNWRKLIGFPWTAGRGGFAESGKYFLSHRAGVWDVQNGECVWNLEKVG